MEAEVPFLGGPNTQLGVAFLAQNPLCLGKVPSLPIWWQLGFSGFSVFESRGF